MKPYIPKALPLDCLDYVSLLSLISEANEQLGYYNGLLQFVVNPHIMLSPLTNQEAMLSSKIEGTQATVDEVFEQEAGIDKENEQKKDIQEIINYRKVLLLAEEALRGNKGISLSHILNMHKILMDSVRGREKNPGEFRKDQNWIGSYGTPIEKASFIPPNPFQLPNYLEDFERYVAFDDKDYLIQTAIVHAQFELLHPFKDGNGRIGRVLIPLFLYCKNKLSTPMFYLSSYLEANRDEYYTRLNAISQKNDWQGWVKFFLKGIVKQVNSNSKILEKTNSLYEKMKGEIREITHSQYSINLLDTFFQRPIFNASQLHKESKIPMSSVKTLIPQLKKYGILRQIRQGRGRKPSIYAFDKLLEIIEDY